jgi:ribosomal protein L24E
VSRRPRWAAVATAVALLGAYGAVQSQSAQAASSETVADPAGDATTRVDPDTGQAAGTIPNEPRADVVSVSAEYQSAAIVLRVKTAEPVDPRSNGVDIQNTSMQWSIDVNNDNNDDFQAEFGADNGALYGDVYRDNADQPFCTGTPSIAADGAWVLAIPLNCIGTPASFKWGGVMQSTRTGQQGAPSDRVPNDGYLGPVEKPGSTPAPTTPTTRKGGNPAPVPTTTTTAPAPIVSNPMSSNEGFWLLGQDGGVFSFGAAQFYGSIGNIPLNKQMVGMAAEPDGSGYWFVGADGGIFAYKAPFWGSTGSVRLTKPIVGMTATPTGKGYWLVASDGGIFSFGDASFYGSTGAVALNKPIVGMAATPTGKGYWLVASDGGIFSFGDAKFFGSTGNVQLNQPIVGMSTTQSGKGYWFVAADGGIFNFGDAPFFGSAVNGNPTPVTAMAATKSGTGYRVVRADGTVLAFGSAGTGGGFASGRLSAPVVAITTAF